MSNDAPNIKKAAIAVNADDIRTFDCAMDQAAIS